MKHTIYTVIASLLVGFALCFLYFMYTAPRPTVTAGAIDLGTSTISNPFAFQKGWSVGTTSAATKFTAVYGGTCNLFASSSGARLVAASTSITADCQKTQPLSTAFTSVSALPGVQDGDLVFIHAPTTTPTTGNGIEVIGYNASTTPGYITVTLMNNTGSSVTVASSTLNGWQYYVLHK